LSGDHPPDDPEPEEEEPVDEHHPMTAFNSPEAEVEEEVRIDDERQSSDACVSGAAHVQQQGKLLPTRATSKSSVADQARAAAALTRRASARLHCAAGSGAQAALVDGAFAVRPALSNASRFWATQSARLIGARPVSSR